MPVDATEHVAWLAHDSDARDWRRDLQSHRAGPCQFCGRLTRSWRATAAGGGSARLQDRGDGREITLYRFGLGESCVLTASAILNQKTFPAIATVEQDGEAVMIPAGTFRSWVNRYDLWRGFVFDMLSQRLASVMETLDEVAFHRMDARGRLGTVAHVADSKPDEVSGSKI